MPFSLAGGVLSAIAAGVLTVSGTLALRPADGGVLVPICGAHGETVPLPIGNERDHREDCPAGCHAVCGRREPGGGCADG